MRKFFIICLIIFINFITNAQNIESGNTNNKTQKKSGINSEISVKMDGTFKDGYVKYPNSINVSYTEIIENRLVYVNYIISTDINFVIDENRENLMIYGKNRYEAFGKIFINGAMKTKKDGSDEILATFSEIIYTIAPNVFTAWLVSKDSKIGNSNTSSIFSKDLFCSSEDIKYKNKAVAFFRIQKDFSLLFIDKPFSLIYNNLKPLSIASYNGSIENVKELLAKGTKVNFQEKDSSTALIFASENGQSEIIKLLLSKGAKLELSRKGKITPLNIATKKGYIEIVKLLLNKGAKVNTKDSDGWTPLLIASYYGYLDIAKLLVEKGANVNLKNNKGESPRLWSSNNGFKELTEFLTMKGATVF